MHDQLAEGCIKVKNSRVWEALDIETATPVLLGTVLSVSAEDALKLSRELWPKAGVIRVKVKEETR
jgi:hypothetical protein